MFKLVFLIILWLFLVTVVAVAALRYFAEHDDNKHEREMFKLRKEYDDE